MSERLLTIIIPVYNASTYLDRCIESVLQQTYQNIEVILVDDGSTDGSGDICDQYSYNDKRIKAFHTENGGSVRARKYGLNRANGEYIGFVDADDYISSDMYEKLSLILESSDAEFVASNYFEVRDGSLKKIAALKYEQIVIRDNIARKQEFSNRYFDGPHMIPYGLVLKLFRREFIMDCFSYVSEEQQYGEDSLVLMWMLIKTRKFVTTSDAFYYYRILDNSLSHFNTSETFEKEFKLSKCRQSIAESNKDVIDEKEFWKFTGKKLHSSYEARARVEQVPIKYHYYYENINALYGKKVIIYGAGNVGYDYFHQLKESDIEVVFAVDLKAESRKIPFPCDVFEPWRIIDAQYDVVVIAIWNKDIANKAKQQMIALGIPEENILWAEPKLL
ncbi:glycosyltransferase [Butyrivibrio sp. NC2007]|uniref:glycosyltransferase n=1 Tax=Butyrivibrio sp. NC2007 TaxID=1280683 RepID=UPI0003B58375|nr:glycosyltransferase [Butyrivibrio sp. NC2007]